MDTNLTRLLNRSVVSIRITQTHYVLTHNLLISYGVVSGLQVMSNFATLQFKYNSTFWTFFWWGLNTGCQLLENVNWIRIVKRYQSLILDEFQGKKSLFFSWSSKQKCIKLNKYIYIYIYILKEIAQSFISQTEERNVVLFISFFVRRNKRQNVESLI